MQLGGYNPHGQCDLPVLKEGLSYVAPTLPALVLQASFYGNLMHFIMLRGSKVCNFPASDADLLTDDENDDDAGGYEENGDDDYEENDDDDDEENDDNGYEEEFFVLCVWRVACE